MIVGVDVSQLEWRTILQLSQDPVGIKEVLEGQDTHSLNQETFKLPSRLISKIYLFRTIFRGSGYAFSVDPEFMHVSKDPSYWDGINEKFYQKYAGIDAIHQVWRELVVNGQPICGPTGRAWTINMQRNYRGELKIPMPTLTNYPVQGTGADVVMVARLSFARRLKASGIPALLISTVHDSIFVDCEAQYVQAIVNLFYQVFDDLAVNVSRTFKMDWNVPLSCECKFGTDMLNMEKIERTDK